MANDAGYFGEYRMGPPPYDRKSAVLPPARRKVRRRRTHKMIITKEPVGKYISAQGGASRAGVPKKLE